MEQIEETNNMLNKLGYAQNEYGIPQNIEELHEFHNQCIKNTIDKAVLREIMTRERETPFQGTEASDDLHSRVIEDIWELLDEEE